MGCLLGVVAMVPTLATAQTPAEPPRIDLPMIGHVRPRSASAIASSSWSVGGETLDRDFADYQQYKKYLGPLGAKSIRLQAGWAKCEKAKGVYDFAWLDAVVDDAISQGVQPWLQTSYGNPIYPGGGSTELGGGIPNSPEALAAWDLWVRALVEHFKARVTTWEIWNEPDLKNANTPEAYTALFIRTAETIRAQQPKAEIFALAIAGNMKFAQAFLEQVKAANKQSLITAVTVHGYPSNPDDIGSVVRMEKLVADLGLSIQVRQGETGAPSTAGTAGALSSQTWTEMSQAKYDLRRMLAHHAHGVPYSHFTLCDMVYRTDKGTRMNTKGLLEARMDKTVVRAKPSYFALQNVFTIFDDSLVRVPPDVGLATDTDKPVVNLYSQKETNRSLLVVWMGGHMPAEINEPHSVDLPAIPIAFTDPVYVDLLSGAVYDLQKDRWAKSDHDVSFRQIPVYDAPVLIAERTLIPLTPIAKN